jgi:hypothetical protein
MWQPLEVSTDQPVRFSPADWPVAIHGHRQSGASFFTSVIVADLIRRGERVVLVCADGQSIREVQAELAMPRPAVKFRAVTTEAATKLEDMQLVTLLQRRAVNLADSLGGIQDRADRMVIVQGVESLMTAELWSIIESQPRMILSGDWSKVGLSIDLKKFPVRILFSEAPDSWPDQRPPNPSYIGIMQTGSTCRQFIARDVAV